VSLFVRYVYFELHSCLSFFGLRASQPLLGAIALTTFIAIWVCSALAPVILGVFIYMDWMASFYIFLVVCVAAYVPGIPRFHAIGNFFGYYVERYFSSFSIIYQDDAVLKPGQKILFTVAPHGAVRVMYSETTCLF
jgi:hypothetical protein